MILRKRDGAGNWRSKQWVAVCGGHALGEAVDLSKTDCGTNE